MALEIENAELAQRITAVETHLQHMASKSWVLGGVVGGAGLAATIALAVMKILGG